MLRGHFHTVGMGCSLMAAAMVLLAYSCLADYVWDGFSWECRSHGESLCESTPLSEIIEMLRSKSKQPHFKTASHKQPPASEKSENGIDVGETGRNQQLSSFGAVDYKAYNGHPSDAALLSTHTSPCDEEDFKTALQTGEGYCYSTYNNGWCRKVYADKVSAVKAAYAAGTWTGDPNAAEDAARVSPGVTYLVEESDWSSDGDDPAADARCISTLTGVATGKIDCKPKQTHCFTESGWQGSDSSVNCMARFGNPVNCPDGIGPNGVYFTGRFDPEDEGYCAAWESPAAARGYMDCVANKMTCTKLIAHKAHRMSPSTGILMMTRIKCTNSGCVVHKAGRCFDVSPSVPFNGCRFPAPVAASCSGDATDTTVDCSGLATSGTTCADEGCTLTPARVGPCIYADSICYEANALEADTKAFAKLAVEQMKAGTVKKCTGNDLAIAEAFIKTS